MQLAYEAGLETYDLDSIRREAQEQLLDELEKELPLSATWHPESDEEVGMISVRENLVDFIEAKRKEIREGEG